MGRTARQTKILEIISKKDIETQEELVEELKKANFDVTQATVSRDIKELGLIKVLGESRKYKYAVEKTTNINVKLTNMFRESVISIDSANNLIVVKTLSGSANAAAIMIDKSGFEGVLGCIAGDDTFLIVCRDEEVVQNILQKLHDIIK
ncbi:MAG TPA: arginine repressor [Clostridia bacterium]|jgi:transcriptional regulator of arginine metabolism